ncbi:MAG: NlpC/P60 family protein [Actinomycetota bacterium]|nr:NlpC/P60 family protein [Actinomycetota bacterium]
MARGTLARRLLVAGTFVWVASRVVAAGEAKPLPIEEPDDVPEAAVAPAVPRRAFRKRFATSVAFSMLFFAGAAFTAGAGNELAPDVTSTDVTAPVAAEATVPAPAPEVVTDETPVEATAAPELARAVDAGDAIVVQSSTPAVSPAPVAASAAPAANQTRPTVAPRHVRRVAVVVSAPAQVVVPLAPIPFQAIAFSPRAWLHNNPASPTGASAVAIAQHYLRVPYVWGGAIPATGFDCSGLTRFVYAQLGVNLPHYAASQFAAFPKLDSADLQPGDLVFFEPKFDGPGHVALYIGNDQMIEAPHTGALVRISSFSGAAVQMGFLGAVRPYTSPDVVAPAVPLPPTRVYPRAD